MIRPTFLAFETAKRALNISQAGLDTVGHNISNAKTAGYTRQRVDQVSLSMGGTSQKYQMFGPANTGMGSNLQGISQIRDPYLDNRYRAEASVNAELGVKQGGLTDINNIFDEIMTDGLYSKMGDVINAFDELGANADSKEFAMVARDEVSAMAQILNKNAQQLEDARTQQKMDLKVTVEQDINSILEKIADLNGRIREDNFYGNPSNELNDARNLLIDNLSEHLDIKVVRTPIKSKNDNVVENVSIELKGTVQPPIKLIDSSFFNKLGVTEDPITGNAGISLLDGISGLPINEKLENQIGRGGVKGYLDVINGEGPKAQEGDNTFRGIPYYMKSLDEYARQLADVFNRTNNITEQQALDSGTPLHDPTIEGAASSWIGTVTDGTVNFKSSPRNYNFDFKFDSTLNTITATHTDDTGTPKTYTANYTGVGPVDFMDGASVAFSVNIKATPKDSLGTISTGTPPLLVATTDKNLVVPLVPEIKDTTTGKTPEWIDTIQGGKIQFSGKDYGITFGFNSATNEMTATMSDGTIYKGTYKQSGAVDFRDDKGEIAFSVNTTNKTPPATTTTNVDAKISAKNVSVSAKWFDDPLYITSTKKNPANAIKSTLTFAGTAKPNWLNSVATGPDAIPVKNGTYKFTTSGAGTTASPTMLHVTIDGIDYKGEYKSSNTIELKGGTPEKVGLVIQTNEKALGTTDAANTATIRNTTGAASDNISKFMSEMGAANTYEVSGINGDLQEFLISFHAQMGLDKNLNTTLQDSSFAVISGFSDRRDAISSVSIDEEGVNMMTYQNYYNAAARYMTTLDEALDKIINGMGMVGR